MITSPKEIVCWGVVIAVLGGLYFVYYRRPLSPAPRRPWWASRWVDLLLALSCFGLIMLWVLPGRSAGRKARVTAQTLFGWMTLAIVVVDGTAMDQPDAVALTVFGLLTAAPIAFWLAGRLLLAAAAVPAHATPSQTPQSTFAWPELRDGRMSG
jgi:hypothetical protein